MLNGIPLVGERLRTAELARRAGSGARTLAVAALLLALASCGCTALLLHRLEAGAPRSSPQQSVGLNLLAEASAGDEPMPGYYRVSLSTVVRKGRDLGSFRVGVLSAGDQVVAVERRDRRVRIVHPLRGWVSMISINGLRILHSDGPAPRAAAATGANASALAQVMQSREAAALAESLGKRAALFAEVEQNFLKTIKQLNAEVALRPGSVVHRIISADQVQSAGKAMLHGAVEFSVKAAGSLRSQKHAAAQFVQQKLRPQARTRLQSLDPQKLFGKEGDKIADAWKEALSK